MFDKMKKFFVVTAAAAVVPIASPANATDLPQGLYQLQNHVNYNTYPYDYGLRLDNLTTPGEHVFDFEHPQADMRLSIDGSTIRIFGTAFGGTIDANTETYDPARSGLWDIDFTYSSYAQAPGDDDHMVGPNPAIAEHWGTISAQFGSQSSYWLQAESGKFDFSFRLGDQDNDWGYRSHSGTSGWGWLTYATQTQPGPPNATFSYAESSDWIFTVGDLIHAPEPSSLTLLALGALAIGRRRR